MEENTNNIVGPTPRSARLDLSLGLSRTSAPNTPLNSTTEQKTNIPLFESAAESNILHNYRSFNYLFTLACIKTNSLIDPQSLRDSEDYYLVAKSAGKGNSVMREDVGYTTDEIIKKNNVLSDVNIAPEDAANIIDKLSSHRDIRKKLVEGFNKNSSGRFDFFIDNLEIDSVMGGNNKTSMSIATNITFDVYEPFGINGFLEALQVSAVAAGHVNYISAPFLLKVEFIGHPDNILTSSSGEKIGKQASRYFVIIFNSVDVEMTAQGTVYRCAATPFNERGYGDTVNKFKTPMQVYGNTVKEILNNLETALNEYEKTNAKKIYGDDKNHDRYEIRFPSTNSQGLDFSTENEISKSKLGELLKSNHTYHYNESPTTESFTPTIVVTDNSNIHDAITVILRDSQFTRDLVIESLKPNSKVIDNLGFVNYFSVNIEVVPQDVWNNKLNRPFYINRYLIIPYKLHYTRIPLLQNTTTKVNSLRSVVARSYDFIYTGKNVDILDFNLKFNHLYYQAVPTYLGNTPLFSSQVAIQPSPSVDLRLASISEQDQLTKDIPAAPVRVDLRNNNVQVVGGLTAPQDFSDPYDAMVKNFHQAILDNLSMVEANVKILGDPYYLLDGGISNYYPQLVSPALTLDGQAPQYFNDIFVNITFRNPFDIDPGTGQYLFSEQNKTAPFSGIFRVTEVVSRFNNGVFEQDLKLLRVPGQPIDTGKKPTTVSAVEENSKLETTVSSSPISNSQISTVPTGVSELTTRFPARLGGAIQSTRVGLSNIIPSEKINNGLADLNQTFSNLQEPTVNITNSIPSANLLNQFNSSQNITNSPSSISFNFGNKNSTNPLQQFLNRRA